MINCSSDDKVEVSGETETMIRVSDLNKVSSAEDGKPHKDL